MDCTKKYPVCRIIQKKDRYIKIQTEYITGYKPDYKKGLERNSEILRKIGLTENEIKIYLNLLISGSSTAYEIGKQTGIYRVHVYDKLEQLMDKGLVTHIYRGAKKYF